MRSTACTSGCGGCDDAVLHGGAPAARQRGTAALPADQAPAPPPGATDPDTAGGAAQPPAPRCSDAGHPAGDAPGGSWAGPAAENSGRPMNPASWRRASTELSDFVV